MEQGKLIVILNNIAVAGQSTNTRQFHVGFICDAVQMFAHRVDFSKRAGELSDGEPLVQHGEIAVSADSSIVPLINRYFLPQATLTRYPDCAVFYTQLSVYPITTHGQSCWPESHIRLIGGNMIEMPGTFKAEETARLKAGVTLPTQITTMPKLHEIVAAINSPEIHIPGIEAVCGWDTQLGGTSEIVINDVRRGYKCVWRRGLGDTLWTADVLKAVGGLTVSAPAGLTVSAPAGLTVSAPAEQYGQRSDECSVAVPELATAGAIAKILVAASTECISKQKLHMNAVVWELVNECKLTAECITDARDVTSVKIVNRGKTLLFTPVDSEFYEVRVWYTTHDKCMTTKAHKFYKYACGYRVSVRPTPLDQQLNQVVASISNIVATTVLHSSMLLGMSGQLYKTDDGVTVEDAVDAKGWVLQLEPMSGFNDVLSCLSNMETTLDMAGAFGDVRVALTLHINASGDVRQKGCGIEDAVSLINTLFEAGNEQSNLSSNDHYHEPSR